MPNLQQNQPEKARALSVASLLSIGHFKARNIDFGLEMVILVHKRAARSVLSGKSLTERICDLGVFALFFSICVRCHENAGVVYEFDEEI